MFNSTIEESSYAIPGNAQAKFNFIRFWSRKLLTRWKPEKKCLVCGFDIAVEACHIRSITDFPKDTKLAVVNSIENLVWLCPNHHVMFDRGLIKLTE